MNLHLLTVLPQIYFIIGTIFFIFLEMYFTPDHLTHCGIEETWEGMERYSFPALLTSSRGAVFSFLDGHILKEGCIVLSCSVRVSWEPGSPGYSHNSIYEAYCLATEYSISYKLCTSTCIRPNLTPS